MLRAYLKQLPTHQLHQTFHFVLGNSSVDFDSFFGSIILAFMMSTATSNPHLPLIDCKPEELKYRFQITYVLDRLKIDPTVFQYQSSIANIPKESWISLYDHNQRKGMTKIDYVVDHHQPAEPVGRKLFIRKMGSCLTHLYYLLYPSKLQMVEPVTIEEKEYIVFFNEFLQGEPFQKKMFEENRQLQIEEIIRYGILIDTFNFDQNQKDRWTIFDKKAVEFIEKDQNFDLGYKQFYDLKFDETLNKNLSLEAALNKDFKSIAYGDMIINYSNIYLKPQQFVQHYSDDLNHQFDIKGLLPNTVDMLMSITKGTGSAAGAVQRALIFRTENEHHHHLLSLFLQSLKMEEAGKIGCWSWWKDPSYTISRKSFDKELRKFIVGFQAQL